MKKHDNTDASSSKIKFEDSDEHESSASEEEEIERVLADVTFEELQKARSDGSHLVYKKSNQEKIGGRANKNRPMEASSKKPVGRFREVIQVPKKVLRDPRFEPLCGTFDDKGFRSRYSFLFKDYLPDEKEKLQQKLEKSNDPTVINDLMNDIAWTRGNLPAEREKLQKKLKKSKNPNVMDEVKNRKSWIDKQLKSDSGKRTDAAILAEHKKKERDAAKKGKQPYYLKRSAIRTEALIKKYQDLKESGKLDSFIEKRRKKNAAKDHRFMPYRRSNNSEDQN